MVFHSCPKNGQAIGIIQCSMLDRGNSVFHLYSLDPSPFIFMEANVDIDPNLSCLLGSATDGR